MPNYPQTVTEVLDPNATYRPAALRAVKEFARSKPWQGTLVERWRKFQQLNAALSEAYGIPVPTLVFSGSGEGDSGASSYCPATHTITLRGRLSVVTYLHEFAHARGMGERASVKYSVSTFFRVWPRSYARCVQVGHTLRRADSR